MDSGSTADDPGAGPAGLPGSLTGPQRSLYERLVDHDPALGSMYVGALVVMESDSPDRLAQACNSARELIQQLVRLRTGPPAKGVGNPRDKGMELRQRWERYKRATEKQPKELLGEEIETELLGVLLKVEEYSVASVQYKHERRTQTRLALPELGLTDADLPEDLLEADVSEMKGMWDFFEQGAHHRSVADADVRAQLGRLEAFLMRWVPQTFAEIDALDELIGGSTNA